MSPTDTPPAAGDHYIPEYVLPGSTTERIRAKLEAGLSPTSLEIFDESEQHRGHGGYREGGETHFRIVIVSPAFAGLSRIDRERRVHALLAEELAGRVHALTLSLRDH